MVNTFARNHILTTLRNGKHIKLNVTAVRILHRTMLREKTKMRRAMLRDRHNDAGRTCGLLLYTGFLEPCHFVLRFNRLGLFAATRNHSESNWVPLTPFSLDGPGVNAGLVLGSLGCHSRRNWISAACSAGRPAPSARDLLGGERSKARDEGSLLVGSFFLERDI